jgi:hypothetical protein
MVSQFTCKLEKHDDAVMWAVGIGRIEEEETSGGGATVHASLQYRWYCSRRREAEDRRLRLRGALGTPAARLRPRPAREKVFSSNLLFN